MSEVLKQIWLAAYDFVLKSHWTVKLVAAVVVFGILFLGVRCGLFGTTPQRVAWEFIPWETPLDCAQATLRADLSFAILEEDGRESRGRLGSTYPAGSEVKLVAKVTGICWMILFSKDPDGLHPVYPSRNAFDTARFDPTTGALETSFKIGRTQGTELYLLVASTRPFRFSDISEALQQAPGKGPDFVTQLSLPKHFAYDDIYFENSGD